MNSVLGFPIKVSPSRKNPVLSDLTLLSELEIDSE